MLSWEGSLSVVSLSVVFDLTFCDGLRASFFYLRDCYIGLRSSSFVVLCLPQRTVFRSETRALFRPRRVSVGLKGFYVDLRVEPYTEWGIRGVPDSPWVTGGNG